MIARRTRAIHEASHAVMAEAVGRRVEQVSIEPVGDLLGHCYSVSAHTVHVSREHISTAVATRAHEGPDPDTAHVPEGFELYNSIWLALAGMAGERVAFGRYDQSGASDDTVRAVTLIVRGYPAEGALAVEGFDRALDLTERKVRGSWPAVERVASALERSGTLTGDEVRRLIAPSIRDRAAARVGRAVVVVAAAGRKAPLVAPLAAFA
jgi:hypothetical protein